MIYAPRDSKADSGPANQHETDEDRALAKFAELQDAFYARPSITSRPETERVHAWADGFGTWHARVAFPDEGYGPRYLDEHADRIRAKARRAIRCELQARQGAPLGTVRLEVESTELDHMNLMHSITYVERAS